MAWIWICKLPEGCTAANSHWEDVLLAGCGFAVFRILYFRRNTKWRKIDKSKAVHHAAPIAAVIPFWKARKGFIRTTATTPCSMSVRIIPYAIPMYGCIPEPRSLWERWPMVSCGGYVMKHTNILISCMRVDIWPRMMPTVGWRRSCAHLRIKPISVCWESITARWWSRKARSFWAGRQCILSLVSPYPFWLKKFENLPLLLVEKVVQKSGKMT